jgi:hypothetical protein
MLAKADVVVCEFGIPPGSTEQEETREALEAVARFAERAAKAESARLALGQQPRMFVLLNCVNNRFERRLLSLFSFGLSPFSTRIRYGPVALPMASAATAGEAARPTALVRRLVSRLASGKPLLPGERFDVAANADAIGCILGDTVVSGSLAGGAGPAWDALNDVIAADPDLEGVGIPHPPAQLTLSAMARSDAWSNARWAACAQRIGQDRTGWVWERAQYLHALDLLDKLNTASLRVLVIVDLEDVFVEAIAQYAAKVDVLDLRTLDPAEGKGSMPLPLSARHVGADVLEGSDYDVIIAPHASLFRKGLSGAAAYLEQVRGALAQGGALLVGGETAMLGRQSPMRPGIAAGAANGFPKHIADCLGLDLIDGEGLGVRRADRGLVGERHEQERGDEFLALRHDNDILWPTVWVFRARDVRVDAVPGALKAALAEYVLGEQIDRMRLGAGASRLGGRVRSGNEAGHAVFGPYVDLPPGCYQVAIEVEFLAPEAAREAGVCLIAEAALGPHVVATAEIVPASGSSTMLEMSLEVMSEAGLCEVRVWGDGTQIFDVLSVRISRSDAVEQVESGSSSLMARAGFVPFREGRD